MAELQEIAEQFAKDLAAQNIAGLMMAFTPTGMGQAMALQGQMAASGPQPANAELSVVVTGTDGATSLVDLIFTGAEGSSAIATRWVDVAGAWKVDGISLKA